MPSKSADQAHAETVDKIADEAATKVARDAERRGIEEQVEVDVIELPPDVQRTGDVAVDTMAIINARRAKRE